LIRIARVKIRGATSKRLALGPSWRRGCHTNIPVAAEEYAEAAEVVDEELVGGGGGGGFDIISTCPERRGREVQGVQRIKKLGVLCLMARLLKELGWESERGIF
jgi:hypothetical protein